MSNNDKPRDYSDRFNKFLIAFWVHGYSEYINRLSRDEQKICEREYLKDLFKRR